MSRQILTGDVAKDLKSGRLHVKDACPETQAWLVEQIAKASAEKKKLSDAALLAGNEVILPADAMREAADDPVRSISILRAGIALYDVSCRMQKREWIAATYNQAFLIKQNYELIERLRYEVAFDLGIDNWNVEDVKGRLLYLVFQFAYGGGKRRNQSYTYAHALSSYFDRNVSPGEVRSIVLCRGTEPLYRDELIARQHAKLVREQATENRSIKPTDEHAEHALGLATRTFNTFSDGVKAMQFEASRKTDESHNQPTKGAMSDPRTTAGREDLRLYVQNLIKNVLSVTNEIIDLRDLPDVNIDPEAKEEEIDKGAALASPDGVTKFQESLVELTRRATSLAEGLVGFSVWLDGNGQPVFPQRSRFG